MSLTEPQDCQIENTISKSDSSIDGKRHAIAIVEQEHGYTGSESICPPADRGSRAFLFLVAACFIEGLMWGFPLTFGVFLSHYQSNEAFGSSPYLSTVGTLATGIPFLGAPFITPIVTKYPDYQLHLITIGWLICILSLILASFSTQAWHLILTQGLLYGVGFLVLYYALLDRLNTWFIEKRGLAYGLLFAAAGLGSSNLPFALNHALGTFGMRFVLRGYAGIVCLIVGPLLPLCRRRVVMTTKVIMEKTSESAWWSMARSKPFIILSLGNFTQSLAAYLPGVYLPLFLTHIGASPGQSVAALCVLNVTQVISQVGMGWLSDRVSVCRLALGSSVISTVAVFAFWLPARTVGLTIMFSTTFGLAAGGYTVLYPRAITALTADPGMTLRVYGMLACQRGLGVVLAGPISSALVGMEPPMFTDDAGRAFRTLIIFTGASLALSSISGVVMRARST